jgi:hypothetical protein
MPSPLARAAGPVALVAGLAFAAVDVARYLVAGPAVPRQVMLTDPAARVVLALSVVGGLSSYLPFALGWVAFGLAGWRSRTFPAVWAPHSSSRDCSATAPGYRRTGSPSGWPWPGSAGGSRGTRSPPRRRARWPAE